MISQFDEQLRTMGLLSSPVRFKLHINLVKLKSVKPLDSKKLTLKITAMEQEKKVEVSADKKIETRDISEHLYSIN